MIVDVIDKKFEDWVEMTFRIALKTAPDKVLWELARKSSDVIDVLSIAAITELGGRRRKAERRAV